MTDHNLLGIEAWLMNIDVAVTTEDGHQVNTSTNSEGTEVKVDKAGNATQVDDPAPTETLPTNVPTPPVETPQMMDGYWWMEFEDILSKLRLLDQTTEYLTTRGVDRAFLTLMDNELTSICSYSFPSAENYDVVGSPKSIVSLEAINAINKAQTVYKGAANKSMKMLSAFALKVSSWLVSKTAEITKSANQILKAASSKTTTAVVNNPQQAQIQQAQVMAQQAATTSTSAPTQAALKPQQNATGPDSAQLQQKISALLSTLKNAPMELESIINRLVNAAKATQTTTTTTTSVQNQRTVANTPTKTPGSEAWSMAAGGVLTPSGSAVTGNNVVGTTRQSTKTVTNQDSAQAQRNAFMQGINQVPLANIRQMVPKNVEFLNQMCKQLRDSASGFKRVGNALSKVESFTGGEAGKVMSDFKLKLKTTYQQYIQALKGASMLLKSSAESLKA